MSDQWPFGEEKPARSHEREGGWQVTMTDLSLLLLCFFLILNTLSSPRTAEVAAFVEGVSARLGTSSLMLSQAVPVTVEPVFDGKAMNLDYVAALMRQETERLFKEDQFVILRQPDRLTLQSPGRVFFDAENSDVGNGGISDRGQEILGDLGDFLSRVPNRVVIEYRSSDWGRSLVRAMLMARVLRLSGYLGDLDVQAGNREQDDEVAIIILAGGPIIRHEGRR